MDYLESLNEKQLEAVSETEGFVRVIAGAGSGKTKLLVCRYAYLVKEYGIDAANILCVTFTNKAAGEMRKRIHALIGDENASSLICTYHGFCARLLREDAGKLFLPKNFQIIDAAQQKSILSEIYQKHELKLDYASFEQILKQIGGYKSLYYNEYVPRFCNPKNVRIRQESGTLYDEIIEEYMQRQKGISALDFNDLLSFALYLLENDREVRSKWQDRLNYIQVDEFQDSSAREMRLIDILSGGCGNLLIVGDPDQNIYEWRGSDVKLLIDFDQKHQPTQTIFLNRNYRSTPQILKCANTLIDNNVLRLKKDLYTQAPSGPAVIHYHSRDETAENQIIADTIAQAVKSGKRKYTDYAILYRSGFLSRVVENKLVEQNIPYEIYGGVKFYQRMEVLDMIAYLRLIAFNDDISFKRIINKPRRRFGRVKMAALEKQQDSDVLMDSGEAQPRLFDVLSAHLSENPFKNSDTAVFVRWIDSIRASIDKMRITEIVNRVSVESGYEEYIRELGDEERYENLMEFKRIADEFERNFGENLTLPEFLQQIALQAGEDKEQARDAVKLMTIHAAKGLEFPVVFVIGFTEGIFPSAKTIEDRKLYGLEEERRLCYVAITRAEEQLYLMDSEGQSQNGIKKLPSRFLREIGPENYSRIGVISKELDMESRDYSRRLDADFDTPPQSEYETGSIVTHHVFGKGKIIATDPKQRTVKVQFENMKMPRNLSVDYFKKEHKTPAIMQTISRSKEPEVDPALEMMPEQSFELTESEPTPEPGALPPPQSAFEVSEPQETVEARIVEAVERVPTTDDEETVVEIGEGREVPASDVDLDPALLARLKDADNLWKRDDVPHSGWACTGITDLGEPADICEMCGHQIIRYVHHMIHPNYRPLSAGCICAGKMEGDIEAARKRERELRNRAARKENFQKRKWKRSKNGNAYLKIKDHLIVLYKLSEGSKWKYAIDSKFRDELYKSRESAIEAAFNALDKVLYP